MMTLTEYTAYWTKFIREQYAAPHGRIALLAYAVVGGGFEGQECALTYPMNDEDWAALDEIVADTYGKGMFGVVSDVGNTGAHYYPNKANPPAIIKRMAEEDFQRFLTELQTA